MEGHYAVGSDTRVKVIGKLRSETGLAAHPTLGEEERCNAHGSVRASELPIQREGCWKSVAFMAYVKAGG